MPKKCSICVHNKRKEIEGDILSGEPLRLVASEFSVSEDALSRHKLHHLRQSLIKAQDIREVAMAGSLLEQLKSLQQKALELLAKAEAAGDYRGALAGVVAARGTLEVLVDIMDRLRENPPVQQQFLSLDQAQISGALKVLLDSRAIVIEGEAEVEGGEEEKRQESGTVEGGDMSREVGDRCDDPPMQIG